MSDVVNSQVVMARLREIRVLKGLSQQGVGDRAGMPRAVLANREVREPAALKFDEAVALAEALGIDLRTLISNEPVAVAMQVHVL